MVSDFKFPVAPTLNPSPFPVHNPLACDWTYSQGCGCQVTFFKLAAPAPQVSRMQINPACTIHAHGLGGMYARDELRQQACTAYYEAQGRQ